MESNRNNEGFVLWFTGLSGSGKTTIANAVHELIKDRRENLERLDGDIIRANLTTDLSFTKEDRDENIKRIAFLSELLSRNGVGIIASFISPYLSHREQLRKRVTNFVEVHVAAPLEVCEARDPKGLYKKARAGEIKLFTGIDDEYHLPIAPDIYLPTHELGVEDCVKLVVEHLEEKGFV